MKKISASGKVPEAVLWSARKTFSMVRRRCEARMLLRPTEKITLETQERGESFLKR